MFWEIVTRNLEVLGTQINYQVSLALSSDIF